MEIENKVALVTGASSGIGREIALELLKEGAHCAIASRDLARLEDQAKEWQGQYPGFSGRVLAVRLDVTKDQDCQAAVEAVKNKWGRLEILVNNAGHGVNGSSAAVPIEEVRQLFDAHYLGATRMVLSSLDLIKQSGPGAIVMVSSIAALTAPPRMSHYSAAKAAMNTLADALRMELAPYGISVLTVMPGITKTEFGARSKFFGGARWSKGLDGMPAATVAKMTVEALRSNRKEIITGLQNRLMVAGFRLFKPLIEKAASRIFGPWSQEDWAKK
ncbi:MAG: SDR family NAD(P)-dependent oxidoreductase [Elusimicrobia bacterium]|nr:SDR family NAD(P)-dependent oxidoreductase [Elusimicrobiota bacterium]